MSVSADSAFTEAFNSMRFPVLRGDSAYCYHCPVGRKRESCDIECLDRLRNVLISQHKQIAAILSGAAGTRSGRNDHPSGGIPAPHPQTGIGIWSPPDCG